MWMKANEHMKYKNFAFQHFYASVLLNSGILVRKKVIAHFSDYVIILQEHQ